MACASRSPCSGAAPSGTRSACSHRRRARAQPANVNAEFPLGTLRRVTGVSGSGKSTLVEDILPRSLKRALLPGARGPVGEHDAHQGARALDKVIDIDQTPIGRTPRSNPATYTGVFTPIRELFAEMPEAKIRGYGPGRFSFNVKGGRCEACQGDGLVKIEMHFLPDVYVTVRAVPRQALQPRDARGEVPRQEHRRGARPHRRGCARGLREPAAHPSQAAHAPDVGLGYIHLGQSATTLSGGEAQRVKLATELSKRDTGRTLYILDEPTTGLHFEDVRVLLEVLHKLVDRGNTVLVIEHNLDVIKTADWIVDLGPEGGSGGGTIVAEGTPEQVAKVKASHTGRYLAKVLRG
jgi:excinuclease ABC subunit A